MNQTTFFKSIEKFYKEGLEIIKKKNQDYANSENPFKNFGFAELVGVSKERACLVRISDKLARISNILGREDIACKDEKIKDTLIDACNYLAILNAMLEEPVKQWTQVSKKEIERLANELS